MNIVKLQAMCQKISDRRDISIDEAISVYFLEQIVKKISESEYKDDLAMRGGYIITRITGACLKPSLDLNINFKNPNKDTINQIYQALKLIFIKKPTDDVQFDISELKENEDPYINTRYTTTITCTIENIVQRFTMNISANDIYARDAVNLKIKSAFGDNNIEIKVYTIEAILSEKLENMYHRGIENYSCDQYCDFHFAFGYKRKYDYKKIRNYINDSFGSKNDDFQYKHAKEIMKSLKSDEVGLVRWRAYLKKNPRLKFVDLTTILDEINLVLLKAAGMYSRKAWRS